MSGGCIEHTYQTSIVQSSNDTYSIYKYVNLYFQFYNYIIYRSVFSCPIF